MNIKNGTFMLPSYTIRTLATAVRKQGWAYLSGLEFKETLTLDDNMWFSFAKYWESLGSDNYMGDKGTYRYRRYSEFESPNPREKLQLLPHGPYMQPLSINNLNGDIERNFLPLEVGFIEHPFFNALISTLISIFSHASGSEGKWNIRLHPYRIIATQTEQGKPTPEGLHRDGVDFIVVMMIDRNKINGGVTRITDNFGRTLHELTLSKPFDLIIADDNRVMHEVSPISCSDATGSGHRDVLVIAFTRVRSQ